MTFKELQAKATPGEWYLGVGTQYCFHSGNRVAMCVGFEEGGEQSECTLAEFWPADHDKDIIDAQLMLHCRKHFARLLSVLEAVSSDLNLVEVEGGSGELAYMVSDALAEAQTVCETEQEDRTHLLCRYRVSLHEEKGDKFTQMFDCQAEDADHAEEQAVNAYPGCEIVNVTQWPEKEVK
jgi:hypothetical protein